jgi:hypothetical protein
VSRLRSIFITVGHQIASHMMNTTRLKNKSASTLLGATEKMLLREDRIE